MTTPPVPSFLTLDSGHKQPSRVPARGVLPALTEPPLFSCDHSDKAVITVIIV